MSLRRWHALVLAGCLVAGQVQAESEPQAEPTPPALKDDFSESTLASRLRMDGVAAEFGEGVPRDPLLAASLYCKAARLGDADAQYNLGWMYTNGRGVERNDVLAAFFFNAAAEQGLAAAQRMLKVVGASRGELPECMRIAPPALPLEAPAPGHKPGLNYERLAPPRILELVKKMAPEFKVEPQLALSIIHAESNFNSLALSPKNARGLMQLIPATAERFGVRNSFDTAQNLRGGLAYLRWLLAYFEGDVALVAAAYNAGEGAVERYRGVPPYAETRYYVHKILKSVGTNRQHVFDANITAPSPSLALMRLLWRKK